MAAEMSDVKVLVVDDDAAVLRLVRATLRDEGFEVSTATNGAEALEQMDGSPSPDAIVLDLEMPVMDGATFFQTVRQRGIQTPVIILSAHGAHRVRRQLGAEAAVDKPFDAQVLVDQLKELAGTPDR